MKYSKYIIPCLSLLALYIAPDLAHADVVGSLNNIQTTFTQKLLPLLATIGLCWAGFSFVMGSPNARSHLFLAVIGAVVGFGANSIVRFIDSLVN